MEILRVEGAQDAGKPTNWDDEKNGHCQTLPFAYQEHRGVMFMVSAHQPTPAEIEALVKGAPVYLGISGEQHPVCFLSVGEPPAPE